MKPLTAVIFFLGMFITGRAQDTLFTYDVKSAAGGYDILQVADEKNNKLYVFMKSRKIIEALEIDLATNQLAVQITEKKEDESVYYNYYGALVNNRVVQLIFDGETEDKFRILNFDFNTKLAYMDNPEADGLGQREVQAFVFNNEFYYLKLKARGSAFVLHKLERDRFSKSTFDFSNDFPASKQTVFDVLTTKTSMSLIPYRDVVIQPVSTIFENDLSEMVALRKLYFYDDKIFITSDDRHFTHVWEMMPQNNQMKYHRVDKAFMKTEGDDKVASNSFLHGNSVFQVQSVKGQVGVRAYDLGTNSSRLFFTADTGTIVQKMYGKRAAIAVMGFPGVLRVRLGARKIQTITTTHTNMGSSTIVTTSTPFGTRWRPGSAFEPLGKNWNQQVAMTMIIDPVTFEAVNKKPELREDKIDSYTSAHITEIGGQEVTRLKEKDIYSYYDKKAKKLVVLEFRK